MKYLYVIMLMLLLASCGNEITENKIVENVDSDIINEIETNLVSLEEKNLNTNENKVIKVDGTFNNTAVDVDMTINYSLDENSTIKTLDINATTFDLTDFNNQAQILVGKTLEEASEIDFVIGGASMTTDAFKRAIKN